MEREALRSKLLDIIQSLNGSIFCDVTLSELKDEASLKDDIGLDSLDFIELLMGCEREFGIGIPDSDVEDGQLATVGQVLDYLTTNIPKNG
jgi:acyl carrier protein